MPLAAPMIWPLEVANLLRNRLRRGRLGESGAEEIRQRLADLQVDVIASGPTSPRRHVDATAAHDLTPWGATYLVLAQQISGPLVTRDEHLARAVRKAGITVFE